MTDELQNLITELRYAAYEVGFVHGDGQFNVGYVQECDRNMNEAEKALIKYLEKE